MKDKLNATVSTIVAGLALLVSCGFASAETVTAIVPYSAGGPTDSIARAVAQGYQEAFPSERVIIDNKPGAGGMIGSKLAAKASPDGKTWLFTDGAIFTVNPTLFPKDASFDVERDLKLASLLGLQSSVLVVHPEFAAKTIKQFVEIAGKKKITYASAGIGTNSHLTMGQFLGMAGLKATHVPYKGAAPAMIDVIGGQVDAAFVTTSAALPYVKSGQVRALAVSSGQRFRDLPEVPTVKESGYPMFESSVAFVVWLPSKTPEQVSRKIETQLSQVLQQPLVRERLATLGVEVSRMSVGEAVEWLRAERERWGVILRENNISGAN